jgi:putative hydrolase of HD superfamily
LTHLDAQFAFLNEADQLKSVLRANCLLDNTRTENSAEHSWHVALWALVFANDAPAGADIARAITMLLLHDLVEIDAGDHPIHLPNPDQTAAEARAAKRLFGLLPAPLGPQMADLWAEFESGQTPTARYAKQIDHAQPMFQALCATPQRPDHIAIVRDNLATGRASDMAIRWPAAHHAALTRLDNIAPQPSDFERTLDFLNQADQLKSVDRATTLCDASRFENSAEHSWHIALYAVILADQAGADVDIARVVQMLLLHDLVEIDVGDVPIHSAGGTAHSSDQVMAAESAAANRIFSILPNPLGDTLHMLWQEFEANVTPAAQFAKSLDRVQPVMQNIQSGGGSWYHYNVTFAQLEARVGVKIANGAPHLWPFVRAQALPFFG